jgi:hypothetical protein
VEIIDDKLSISQPGKINLTSILIEGLELEVLWSNVLIKYLPKVLIVELLGVSQTAMCKNEIKIYLETYVYKILSILYKSRVFSIGGRGLC